MDTIQLIERLRSRLYSAKLEIDDVLSILEHRRVTGFWSQTPDYTISLQITFSDLAESLIAIARDLQAVEVTTSHP